MSNSSSNSNIHLPSLYIDGFRGIQQLSVPRLSRVTLITGKNGVGKTTILEAVRTYAERGRLAVLSELLTNRDEITTSTDEDGEDIPVTDFISLFHGRDILLTKKITIGPVGKKSKLKIIATTLTPEEASDLVRIDPDEISENDLRAIEVSFGKSVHKIPWRILYNTKLHSFYRIRRNRWERFSANRSATTPQYIRCLNIGPGLLSNEYMTRFWDDIALTDYEDRAVHAFRKILGINVERIAVVGNGFRAPIKDITRRILVKVSNHSQPVPLKSLGDGAVRLFSVAMALANSRDGFLVIDEAENGIHHSVQRKYWELILHTAQEFNVQVLATTHSWDCVRGFAQATMHSEEYDGSLYRIEKEKEQTFVIEYTKEEVQAAAEHGIEVR